EGWFDAGRGKLIINAGNLTDETRIRGAIREEGGHKLLSTPEGQYEARRFSDQHMTDQHRAHLSALYPQLQGESTGDYRLRLADEFIAKTAREQPKIFRRIVEGIRGWLSDNFGLKLTAQEVARATLRSLQTRAAARAADPGAPAARRAAAPSLVGSHKA